MQLKNSEDHFGLVAILLHWIMALILIGLVILGLYMTSLPLSAQKLKLYGWHKEFGMLVLFLVMFRIVWRLGNRLPSLHSLNLFERFAARAVHWAFYLFMFALPITGWLITSSAGLPVSFFGWFVIPTLIAPNDNLRPLLETIHEWLAYGLIALFSLHLLAALKHHFINKDDILRRMIL
jgi:cytochrome b561